MNFVRAEAGLRHNCKIGPREQFNEISSVLDAGTVYSNSPEKLESLRLYKNGFLKTLPVFQEFNMRDLLPLKLEAPDEGCIRPSNYHPPIIRQTCKKYLISEKIFYQSYLTKIIAR